MEKSFLSRVKFCPHFPFRLCLQFFFPAEGSTTMVVGGCGIDVWFNNGIGWRWDLLGRGRSICVCSDLLGGVESKKGCARSNCPIYNGKHNYNQLWAPNPLPNILEDHWLYDSNCFSFVKTSLIHVHAGSFTSNNGFIILSFQLYPSFSLLVKYKFMMSTITIRKNIFDDGFGRHLRMVLNCFRIFFNKKITKKFRILRQF